MARFQVIIEDSTRERFYVKGLPRVVSRVIAYRVRAVYLEVYGVEFPRGLTVEVDGVLMQDIENAIPAIVVHVHRRMNP